MNDQPVKERGGENETRGNKDSVEPETDSVSRKVKIQFSTPALCFFFHGLLLTRNRETLSLLETQDKTKWEKWARKLFWLPTYAKLSDKVGVCL